MSNELDLGELDNLEREYYIRSAAPKPPTVGETIETIGGSAEVLAVEQNTDRMGNTFPNVLTITTPSGSPTKIYWGPDLSHPLPMFAVTRIG